MGAYKKPKFKVPKKREESIVDASLRYLCELDEFAFELDDSYSIVFEKIRLLRNNFAHGDWANVRIILSEISLSINSTNRSDDFSRHGMMVSKKVQYKFIPPPWNKLLY